MRLYERPVNLFVAGFFGSPAMNFFRGTLSQDGSHLVQDGATVWLGDLRASQPVLTSYAGRDQTEHDLLTGERSRIRRFVRLTDRCERDRDPRARDLECARCGAVI
jgi:ABC-type sugar transport system ATPase subunit